MAVGEVFLLLVSLVMEGASLELEDQTLGLDLTKGWTQQDFVRNWSNVPPKTVSNPVISRQILTRVSKNWPSLMWTFTN